MVQKNENKEEDQLLVEKVLRGDTGSFAVIIKKTERLVAQIIFKMITFPEDRKDLAQEVYLKVYKNLKGFQFQSRLTTWVAEVYRKIKLMGAPFANRDLYKTAIIPPDHKRCCCVPHTFIAYVLTGAIVYLRKRIFIYIHYNQ